MIEIKRVTSFPEAEQYRDAWNKLAHAPAGGSLATPSVFQTYEFTSSWWQAFGQDNELLLLLAFENGALAGVAPLLIERRRFPIPSRVVQFIGGSNFASDYGAILTRPGHSQVHEAFARWLVEHPKLWTELEFRNVQENAPELAAFGERFDKRYRKSELSYYLDAPTRILGRAGENDELKNRRSLKRRFSWFEGNGKLSFGHLETTEEILPRLDTFFAQHKSRWSNGPGATSQFSDERQREFYRLLVHSMNPQGWLRFFAVELDGRPVAFHFGFEFAGKYYWYKPTFDTQYTKRSPGDVLLKTLFDYSIERGLAEFDFTAGGEAYKLRYANHVRKLYCYRAYRSWPQLLVRQAEAKARALARSILLPLRNPRRLPVEIGLLYALDAVDLVNNVPQQLVS